MSGYNLGDIYTRIKIDTSEFKKSAAGLKKSFADIGKSGLGFAAAQVGLDSIRGAINFVRNDIIKAASDFEETTNLINVGFGEQAAYTEQWAEATGAAMGRSTQQMRDFAGTMQAVLPTLVGNEKAAASMSREISKLAVDLGSFYNVADDQALNALRAGLTGEAEPLKRFGVLLNEAAIKSKAMEMGIKGGTKALTDQQKTAIRYAIIMEQTHKAQGDAVRTSDSYANSVKAMNAQIQNASTEVGLRLLPFLAKLSGFMPNLISGTISFAKATEAALRAGFTAIAQFVTNAVAKTAMTLEKIELSALETWASVKRFFGSDPGDALEKRIASTRQRVIDYQEDIGYNITAGSELIQEAQKDLQDAIAESANGYKSLKNEMTTSEIWDAVSNGASKAANSVDKKLNEKLKDSKDRIKDLREETNNMLSDAVFENYVSGFNDLGQQIIRINKKYDEWIENIKKVGKESGLSAAEQKKLIDTANQARAAESSGAVESSARSKGTIGETGQQRASAPGQKSLSSKVVGSAFKVLEKIGEFVGKQLKKFGAYIFNSVMALEPFQVLFSELNEVVQETLNSAFKPLLFAVKPLIVILANAFSNLGPLFGAVANALAALGPLFEDFLNDVLPPIINTLNAWIPIIQALTPLLKFVANIILKLLAPALKYIAWVFNVYAKAILAVINFVRKIIRKPAIEFEEIKFDDSKVKLERFNDALRDSTDAVRKTKKSIYDEPEREPGERLREILQEKANTAARAAVEAAEKRKELEQQTLDILSGGNENLPAGFKLALEKFKAIDVDDFIPGVGPQDPLVAAGDSLQLAASMLMNASFGIQNPNQLNPALAQASGSGRGLSIQTMQVVANNPRQLMRELDNVSQIRNSTNTGNPYSTDILGRGRF